MDSSEEPFQVKDIQVMETSFIDQVPLDAAETCLFKGEFVDKEHNRVGTVILPDSFFALHQAQPNMDVFKQVGLDGYFGLEPWGIDHQRAYELMTTIGKDGVATLTNKIGIEVQVQITEELISEALKLPTVQQAYKIPHQLTEKERKETFKTLQGSKETFSDLRVKELDLPLRLYSQHFVFGKPVRYTLPCKRVAGLMMKARANNKVMKGDFCRVLRQDLILHKESKNLKEKPYLANGQLLTRIAYQALDMIDELPQALSQEQASSQVGPIKVKPISMIIPPRDKSKRTLCKGGKPVGETGTSSVRAEQLPEEPSRPPVSSIQKRMRAERMAEALKKVKERSVSQQRKEGNTVDPERRTKQRQDPREVAAREEREETLQAKKGLEALGREVIRDAAERLEQRGSKRIQEDFMQNMQETTEGLERLIKKQKMEEAQQPGPSQLMEEAQHFAESIIQTPPSQKEQKEGERNDEAMLDVTSGNDANTDNIPLAEDINNKQVEATQEKKEEPEQGDENKQALEEKQTAEREKALEEEEMMKAATAEEEKRKEEEMVAQALAEEHAQRAEEQREKALEEERKEKDRQTQLEAEEVSQVNMDTQEKTTEKKGNEPASGMAEQAEEKEEEAALGVADKEKKEKNEEKAPKEAQQATKETEFMTRDALIKAIRERDEAEKEKIIKVELEKEKKKLVELSPLVLRRQVKTTEVRIQEREVLPIQLIEKKEGTKGIIHIEDDEEDAELKQLREEEARAQRMIKLLKEKEGQTVVQQEAGTSSQTLIVGTQQENEQKESEKGDKIDNSLCRILDELSHIDQLNTEKERRLEQLYQLNEEQLAINEKQQQYIADILERELFFQRMYEGEMKKNFEQGEELAATLQRATQAEKNLKESQEALAGQKLQNEQMQIALQVANRRRVAAEDELDRLLSNPTIAASKMSPSDEAFQRAQEELQGLLRAKESQILLMSDMFLQKEQDFQKQLRNMQEKLENSQRELVLKEQVVVEPRPGANFEKESPFELLMDQIPEEAGTAEQFTSEDLKQLSQAEAELTDMIKEALAPIQKECMEWERRILHSAAKCFPKAGEANRAYNRPTLPFPLLKHEFLMTKEELTLPCNEEDLGGYQPVSLEQWQSRENMQNQPAWRLGWFRRYPNSKTAYARAPRELRIDPTFCPVRRRRSWDEFKQIAKVHPTWLNFPLLPAPQAGQEPTESYMLETLKQAINQFKGVPDLACQMLIKICKMIITCIEDFHDSLHMRATWTRFLEGRIGLSWNLQLAPEPQQIMRLFARLHFVAGHFLQTFEDAFYTGFFEYQSHIFGPLVSDLGARFIAYQAMELMFPLRDMIEDARRERDHQRHLQALDYINKTKSWRE